MTTLRGLALCGVVAIASGCTTYYKVNDPTTGKTYYTTQLQRRSNGNATLRDGRTGNTITLQDSEVAKIRKQEYEAGRATAPTQSAE